jgi:exopolysaccharide biosynthesis polyprenyl glycosylphosphotransferase
MNKTLQTIKYFCCDLFSLILSWKVFIYFLSKINNQFYQVNSPSLNSYADILVISFVWMSIYSLAGYYKDVLQKSRIKEFFIHLILSLIGINILYFLFFINLEYNNNQVSLVKTLTYYLSFHFIITVAVKLILMSISKYQIRHRIIYYNTLLIGSNQIAKNIYDDLETKNIYLGLKFLGFINVGNETNTSLSKNLNHLGSVESIETLVKNMDIEQVVIAIEPSEHEQIAEILTRLDGLNVKISIIPDMYQMLIGSVRISHVLGLPLIEIKQELMPTWQIILKRTIDILISLTVLIIGLPFFIIIATITNFSSKGSPIYRQVRIGRYGKPFKIIKFRSMFIGSELEGYALSKNNDPRITPWGRFMRKTRIDEMPQFYNVLIGNMSLVGPRPERQYFIDQIMLQAPHYKHLQKVKPGITSLGMVKFGYAENVDEMIQRLQFDIIYIENMSLLMDFRIMIYTIITVISAKGK